MPGGGLGRIKRAGVIKKKNPGRSEGATLKYCIQREGGGGGAIRFFFSKTLLQL